MREDKIFKLQIVYESWGGTNCENESNNDIIMENDDIVKMKENFNRLKRAMAIYKKINFRRPEQKLQEDIPYYITMGKSEYRNIETIQDIQFLDDNGNGVSWSGAYRFFDGSDYGSWLHSAEVISGLSVEF